MIALLSVPNTGTWFTLNLLELHPEIEHVIDYNAGFFGIFRKEINRHSFRYEQPCKDFRNVIYRRHILGNRTHGEIDLICMGHKAVIPMRDPLASLISRKHRNPLEPMYEHIDAFEYLATSPHVNRSFILPIDTEAFRVDKYSRLFIANDLFDHLNIQRPEGLKKWADDNEPKNTMGGYEQKKAYQEGDVELATSHCIGEFEYLKSKTKILRPWLEYLGYENLIWW